MIGLWSKTLKYLATSILSPPAGHGGGDLPAEFP
jgi:hypothetical protein